MTDRGVITQLLHASRQGSREALDALLPLVYDELQVVAHRHMKSEREGHTLNTGALVNETYLRMAEQDRAEWQNRAHFFAVAAMVMRRVLVNYAVQHNRLKRGGGAVQVTLNEMHGMAGDGAGVELEALDQALTRLAAADERAARVIECRYFAGLSIEETAEALNVAPATVKRDWMFSKTWLRRELERGG